MRLFEKTTNLSIMLGFGLLVLGCGENPEDNSALEMAKGPPQIKIALHSQLELDFSLDPAPKLRVSKIETDKLGAVDNKPIAGVNENYKKISMLPPQSARRQAFKNEAENSASAIVYWDAMSFSSRALISAWTSGSV